MNPFEEALKASLNSVEVGFREAERDFHAVVTELADVVAGTFGLVIRSKGARI